MEILTRLNLVKPKQKVIAKLEKNGTKEQSQTNRFEDRDPIAMIYEPKMS